MTLTALPVDLIIECSGVTEIAAKVALTSLLAGKDVALMTVEADVTVGLLLAKIARNRPKRGIWRRVPESNRSSRICNPLRNLSANPPEL